jgi:uncharacterized protein YcfL
MFTYKKSTRLFHWFRGFISLILIGILLPTSAVLAQTPVTGSDPFAAQAPIGGFKKQALLVTPNRKLSANNLISASAFGVNLVQDPSFEASFSTQTYWSQFSYQRLSGMPTCTTAYCGTGNNTAKPHSGSVWVWFGGVPAGYDEYAYVGQYVSIPACASATLQFYFWIGYAGSGSGVDDEFNVWMDNTLLFQVNATQKSSYSSYKLVSLDVSSFADGNSHQLYFEGITYGQTVNFSLDDISLVANFVSCHISGNTGTAGVTLSYTDGSAKSVTSQGDGSYSLPVSYNWSGTVTPTHPCFTFSPTNTPYSNVLADQIAQNYVPTFNAASGCADIDVSIGGSPQRSYGLGSSQSMVDTYPLSNGPVTVESTNALNLMAAERVIFSVNNTPTSYSEMMGLPQTQLAPSYLFPWYNNLQLNSQLRFGNVGSSSTVVSIKIHGVTQATTYTLLPGQSTTATFPVSDGPVEVVSDGQNLIAAERVIFSVNGLGTSYSELMGLPQTKLATSYLFPWYNNLQLNSQLRFGNVGSSSTVVSIKIHGVTQPTTYTLLPGESTTATFPVSDGPVEVVSDGQNIIAAERVIFSVNGVGTSYSELMGLPQTQLATSYLFPWYNNLQLNAQLRFGNVGSSSTVVSIKIHGVTQATTYTLLPGESTTTTFPVSDGPVEVLSDGQNIIAAERVIFSVNNTATSYSELMGLPQTQLTTSYLFPWYNNLQLNAQLRFAVP